MRTQRDKLPNKIDLRPASKRQIDYAASLGICLPQESTVSDASALINQILDDDIKASQGLLDYAALKEIKCSPYVGNKYLHNLIFDNIEEAEKAAFFCFCIYKFYVEGCGENFHAHKHKAIFKSFGSQYKENFYFKTSMEEYCGEELIAFGKRTKVLEDGTERTVYGSSIHTTAYKIAYEYLTQTSSLLG